MTLALLRRWAVNREEVVDPSVGANAARKHMPSITEPDLITVLHHGAMVFNQRIREHVHHVELVTAGNDDMEATRVEGYSCRLLTRWGLPG